jgi:hypothetical protein
MQKTIGPASAHHVDVHSGHHIGIFDRAQCERMNRW